MGYQNLFFSPQPRENTSPAFIAKFILNYYQQYLEWVQQKIALPTKNDLVDEKYANGPEVSLEEETVNINSDSEVWVYNAYSSVRTGLASAVFCTKENAKKWVEELRIEGLLTAYPVDKSAYDWAVKNLFFTPKKPHHYEPRFIGTFTGGQKHFHYVDIHESGQFRWS